MDISSKQNGFTLIELIVVISLISILAAGVYLNWPGSTMNLAAQTRQLANDLRYTQALSMTTGQRYRLVRTSSNTYQILNSSGSAMVLMGRTTITLASGITFGSLTNLPNSLVAFNGLGAPYTDTGNPGTPLSTTATLSLTTNGETRTVSITPETGRVSVS